MGSILSNTSKNDQNLETYSLIWLDASFNNSQENIEAQKQLRASINHLLTFENEDLCHYHIQSIPQNDRIVLIVSGRLGRILVPKINQLRQVTSIYVYYETLSINIFNTSEKSTSELNGQFLHSQLSIECLIRMKINSNEKKELIDFCTKEYNDNPSELKIVKEFEENYLSSKSLLWYTRQSFVYRLLNKALRIQNIDVLYLFRFLIRDIGKELP